MAKAKSVEKSDSFITAKKNAAERRRDKIAEVASKFKGGNEPDINPFEYQLSLMICLNWYNINADLKDIRGYLNDYLISTNRKNLVPTLNKVSDFDIKYTGLLSRLKLRNQYLSDEHEASIESKIVEFVQKVQLEDANVDVVVPKVKVDRSYEQSIAYCEAFEEAIDEFVKKRKTSFIPIDYIKSKEIPAPVSKKIGEYYSTVLQELRETLEGDDEQLVEGYSNFTNYQLKKFILFIESIVTACTQQVVSLKAKSPRKTKPVSPIKMVSKVKYAKEFIDLNLKSIQPTTMVGANEIWTYNTKYRKLAVYKSESGGKLSVKGTTILGFDITESQQVMLRKPEEFFKDMKLGKKILGTKLKDVTTRPVTPNGRLNEETIILGAF